VPQLIPFRSYASLQSPAHWSSPFPPSSWLSVVIPSLWTIIETCKEGHIPLVTSLLPEVSVTIDGAPTVGIEQLSIETWQDTNDFLQI